MPRKNFNHLTWTDRLRIETAIRVNPKIKQAEIAELVGKDKSTICRELRRGTYTHLDGQTYIMKETYSPDIAQGKYDYNLKGKGADLKISKDKALADFLEKKMRAEHLSPQAALVAAAKQGHRPNISRYTIYKYIHGGVFLSLEMSDLPSGKSRKRYKHVAPNNGRASRSPRGTSIENRPEHINNRSQFGHWEIDTVEGKQGTQQALLVLTERKTRTEIIERMKKQNATEVVSALKRISKSFGKAAGHIFLSLTSDNGKEFADTKGMRTFVPGKDIAVYTCHPYCASERGSNENANRFIRRKQFIPKGKDISKYSNGFISAMGDFINDYPRPMFGGKSAKEMFDIETVNIFTKTKYKNKTYS